MGNVYLTAHDCQNIIVEAYDPDNSNALTLKVTGKDQQSMVHITLFDLPREKAVAMVVLFGDTEKFGKDPELFAEAQRRYREREKANETPF